LATAYLANIDYISRNWLRSNIGKIFPQDFPANFICAIQGLTYASANRLIYELLLEHGVLDRALRLSLISFFSSIRGQELTVDQIERILCFWEKCVLWAQTLPEPPKSLLSALSRLIRYVTTFGDREIRLLMAVAPHVKVGYNADNFIEKLDRLIEQDPAKVSSVLGKVLETYEPDYDYEDRLKKLLIKLAERGRREDVLLYADRIRKLPGIDQLFKQLADGII